MLVPIANSPREYAWGSKTLIAQLEGRPPASRPEAEVWFGDHAENPAVTEDGRLLTEWLAAEKCDIGKLPYLVKLLAAGSVLSIQAHPSKAQAEAGFARENAEGVPLNSRNRIYKDNNHKPEVLVALSEKFYALVGLREKGSAWRLARQIGAIELIDLLTWTDGSLEKALSWVLDPANGRAVSTIISRALNAESGEFAAELDLIRSLSDEHPRDPGVLVALLMNYVTLERGEGLFIPAGELHAYVYGLGLEVMTSSDNVLRGGLTEKHMDVRQLLETVNAVPSLPHRMEPQLVSDSVERYAAPIEEFCLYRIKTADASAVTHEPGGVSILVTVAGEMTVSAGEDIHTLGAGQALLVTPGVSSIILTGDAEVFLVEAGNH